MEASYKLDPTKILLWCSGHMFPQMVPAITPLKFLKIHNYFDKEKFKSDLVFPPKIILVEDPTIIPRLFISLQKITYLDI